MLINFLNQTCNITQKVVSISWWEQNITFTTIYSWIKCYYYWQKQKLDLTNNAVNTDLTTYKAIIEPDKTLVRDDMIIEIIDPDLWNIWKFLIEWPKVNRLIDWTKDSIQLTLKKYD